jgi:hypothetical protein
MTRSWVWVLVGAAIGAAVTLPFGLAILVWAVSPTAATPATAAVDDYSFAKEPRNETERRRKLISVLYVERDRYQGFADGGDDLGLLRRLAERGATLHGLCLSGGGARCAVEWHFSKVYHDRKFVLLRIEAPAGQPLSVASKAAMLEFQQIQLAYPSDLRIAGLVWLDRLETAGGPFEPGPFGAKHHTLQTADYELDLAVVDARRSGATVPTWSVGLTWRPLDSAAPSAPSR